MSDIIDIPMNNTEIAKQLDVAASSLRKWCIALEEHNYTFERTDRDKRLFYSDDVKVLKYFKELVTTKNMSLKNAAVIISDRFTKENNKVFFNGTELEQVDNSVFSSEADNEQEENKDEIVISKTELANILRTQQEQLFSQLKEQLKHELIQDIKDELATVHKENNDQLLTDIKTALSNQDERINNTLDKRDKYLVDSLKESMETKKQIAASIEDEKSKKKKWYQVWK